MKKSFKIALIIFLCAFVAVLSVLVVSAVIGAESHSGSVGIIGGADGPTAILVSKTLIFSNPLFYILAILFIAVIVSAVGLLVCKKK